MDRISYEATSQAMGPGFVAFWFYILIHRFRAGCTPILGIKLHKCAHCAYRPWDDKSMPQQQETRLVRVELDSIKKKKWIPNADPWAL